MVATDRQHVGPVIVNVMLDNAFTVDDGGGRGVCNSYAHGLGRLSVQKIVRAFIQLTI
jgi:hypothetical protein